MGPYRTNTFPSWSEEDLWLRLDDALEVAFSDPSWAFNIAWSVIQDATDFRDVFWAAADLLEALGFRLPPDWDWPETNS